eukprot:9021239-Pyramimonas_sp.AAC.1
MCEPALARKQADRFFDAKKKNWRFTACPESAWMEVRANQGHIRGIYGAYTPGNDQSRAGMDIWSGGRTDRRCSETNQRGEGEPNIRSYKTNVASAPLAPLQNRRRLCPLAPVQN